MSLHMTYKILSLIVFLTGVIWYDPNIGTRFLHLPSHFEQFWNTSKPNVTLIIGVLSKRDHFENRKAIRSTWKKDIESKIIDSKVFFVLGDRECNLHPDNRIDVLGCEEWKSNFHDNTSAYLLPFRSKVYIDKINCSTRHMFSGFGFKIIEDVYVISFTVNFEIVKLLQSVKISLRDAEEVFEEAVVEISKCHAVDNFCEHRLSKPLLLPSGFEGEIFLSLPRLNEYLNLQGDCKWVKTRFLKYLFLRSRNGIKKWHESECPVVGGIFKLRDCHGINDTFNEKQHIWHSYCADVERQIEEEMKEHHDIVLLHLEDYYRNLPMKLLHFMNWLMQNYNFKALLKVDDDVIVNTKYFPMFFNCAIHEHEAAIWSKLMQHHMVPHWGKWADYDYMGLTYPSFPSGAGYMLTETVVCLLSSLSPFLRGYAGEDVSIGIWLSALAFEGVHWGNLVSLIDVPCWFPNECNYSLIVPEVSLRDFHSYFENAQ